MPGSRYRRRTRRGYPVALLLGIDERRATLWTVHSDSIVPSGSISCEHKGSAGTCNPRYNYFDAVVARLKIASATGVKSIVVAGPKGTPTAKDLVAHVNKHHLYLLKPGSGRTIHIATIDGSAANDVPSTIELVKSPAFKEITESATGQETEGIVQLLDAVINNPSGIVSVHFTLDEILQVFEALHDEIGPEPEYVLMTENFYASTKNDQRLQRIFSLAKKYKVKTRVIQSKTGPGARIAALGGMVCFTSPPP
jgi:stalled ribosome rescue protein Dom34